ncbi:hypothetical protein [Ruminiclostridium cellobioparum]|uniref:Uncharacterized protein n=1 Tax=Ruminiclostridium cellobioparum subsp. termitidis CT1112 TaxID=1195236 RepID=S0FLV7_RUMCE|nr:hypothetical protein [Ruminiclostridium cellobioparum]EMS72877.1 hypothetical protein CTER_1224 [Ruminiclostridium cellobioparum subsp. termitidis CT1112]
MISLKELREQNKLPQKYIADFFAIDVREILDYLPNDIRNLYIGTEMQLIRRGKLLSFS